MCDEDRGRYPHPSDVNAAIVMGAIGMFFGLMGFFAFIAALVNGI